MDWSLYIRKTEISLYGEVGASYDLCIGKAEILPRYKVKVDASVYKKDLTPPMFSGKVNVSVYRKD